MVSFRFTPLQWVLATAALTLACGSKNRDESTRWVNANVETAPIRGDADDPEVWVHPTEPARSTIIGTDKSGGIEVYDLNGTRLQRRDDGSLNSVDVRGNIVAASNRSNNTIALYRVDPKTRALIPAGAIAVGMKIYGLCLYRSTRTAALSAFVNAKTGEIAQFSLDTRAQRITGAKVRELKVPTQPEGCVADDDTATLYVGEEDVGIWRFGAEPNNGTTGTLLQRIDGSRLTADVEGLTLYRGADGGGYLIASSQGDNAYVIYRRKDLAYVGRFRITTADKHPVAHSDGIAATSAALGPAFPCGVFVAHDSKNKGATANFKVVAWERIAAAFSPPLERRCAGRD